MGKKKSKKEEPLNEGFYIEAIDRAYIVANMIEDVLINHPVFEKHLTLKKKVEDAQQLILDAYQEIGGLTVDLFPPSSESIDSKEVK